MTEYVAKNTDNGREVLNVLLKEFGFSKAYITKLKTKGEISVDGNHVTVRYKLKQDEVLRLTLPLDSSENVVAEDIPLTVIYEDHSILAVEKPEGMPVHPSLGNYSGTLGNAVAYYYKDKPFVYRPINRLDKNTSGIVLIAKTGPAAFKLSQQMKNRGFNKRYYAVIKGIPSEKRGVIDAPIRRKTERSLERIVSPDGKRAVTEYEVVSERNGNTLVSIGLHTGRTHQIRVHFAHIGHPLLSDFLYGEEIDGKPYKLHCSQLGFNHPETGKRIDLKSTPEWIENY